MADPLAPQVAGTTSRLVNDLPTVNAVYEACRLVNGRLKFGERRGERERNPLVPQVDVWVRNDTGGTLPEFSVVALGTPLISAVDAPFDFRRTPVFPGTVPSASTDPFAVTIEPIAHQGIGRAAVLGVMPVDLVVNDVGHTRAGPAAGVSATLNSGTTGGAQVIWKQAGTGTKRAVVLIDREGGAGATSEILLCEVYSLGSSVNHTVKRKTWDAGTNAIVDYPGPVTFANCRTTTGATLAVGTIVLLDPIPDVSGNYWITPAAHSSQTKQGFVSTTNQEKSGSWTVLEATSSHATNRPSVVLRCDDGDDSAALQLWSDQGDAIGMIWESRAGVGVFTIDDGTNGLAETYVQYDGGTATYLWDLSSIASGVGIGLYGPLGSFANGGFGTCVIGSWITFAAAAAAAVTNNSLFRDLADGKLKFKDAGGTVNALY